MGFRATDLPYLGVGVGFRPPFRAELFFEPGNVDFLEITADHYLHANAEKRRELALLRERFTLVPHSLELSLGSAEGVDRLYLDRLAELIELIDPPYFSDHIAFTHARGVEIGHLAPLPFTHEAIDIVRRNVDEVRRVIDRPLLLENITYEFLWPGAEMSEPEFLTQVVEACDCGLLLDITNVFCNCANFGLESGPFLAQLPHERIAQLHFVGVEESRGRWIDSHARPTPPAIFALMAEIARTTQLRGVVLERDENLPHFSEIVEELAAARKAWAQGAPPTEGAG